MRVIPVVTLIPEPAFLEAKVPVVALATPGWSSVHSVIDESDFWEIIEQLKLAGAEGILVVPIEKMIL
ncbi:MAG: hypothetical protein EBS98_06750 [Chitinophagia bacterium]|nr:hypothetical protein [Chitinophagia bacterium]